MRKHFFIMTLAAASALFVLPARASDPAPVAVVPGPSVDVQPGPDILHAGEAPSPLLENVGIWQAEPIMVSGASAYRAGEFLYQDYLYDESGTYPEDPAYSAKNNADLVELRLEPTEAGTAIRLTLNSLQDFAQVGVTLALGGSLPQVVPHGANARMPAEVFVTVHGTTGDIVEAATGMTLPHVPQVSVDTLRRQVDVQIPYAAFDPRGRTVRVGAAVGLWDPAANAYRPKSMGAAFYNVAFRYSEPPGPPYPPDFANTQQTAALQAGDLTAFAADVDFAKLAAETDDDMPGEVGGVPQTGRLSRIFASHFEPQQGRGPANTRSPTTTEWCRQPCDEMVEYPGQLQPYTLDVPSNPPSEGGYALTYVLHGCGVNYRSNPALRQIDPDQLQSLVVYPEGRGACHWYWSLSGADVFEAVGDVMRRYPVDNELVYVTGGSMGGYGTYRLAAVWPDLFAAAAPVIGCTAPEAGWTGPGSPAQGGEASTIHPLAPSWRHVPLWSVIGMADTTCQLTANRALLALIDGFGYRYEWREYPGEHVSAAFEAVAAEPDQWMNFFAGRRAVRDPARVTYVYNAVADEREFGLRADHAYWISGLAVRDPSGDAPKGAIDVFSHGLGVGDPQVGPTESTVGPGYTGQRKGWGAAPATPAEDVLDIVATNIASVTIDVARARVDCDPMLNVTSDGPVTITLAGCLPEPGQTAQILAGVIGLLGIRAWRARRVR